MKKENPLEYFGIQATTGEWESLYNPGNPKSYSFIVRLKKSLELLGNIENKTVCDLGCGTGVLIPFIIERGGYYTGIDNCKDMLDFIRINYSKEYQSDKVLLINNDFENLKTNDAYDFFIGLGFIEYFNAPKDIIKKIYDMMPDGGQLILSFPNYLSLDYFALNIFAPVRYMIRKISDKRTIQPPRKLWTIKRAKKLLQEAGYKDFKITNYSINFFFYPFSRFLPEFCNYISKMLEYSFLAKFSFFSTGFIISAKK